jgi:hypothetical protein
MAEITTYLSILTLNVNGLSPLQKDTLWQTTLKRKIWQSVVYNRPILLKEMNTGLGWEAGRRFIKPLKTGRSSNTYIKQSRHQTYIGQTRQGWLLHTNKSVNTSKGKNNYQPYAPNDRAPNFIKPKPKDLKAHTVSNTVIVGDFNTPLSPIVRPFKQKNQKRSPRTKGYHRSNGPNWCLQNISSNNITINILLRSSWNFLQNRLHLRAQSKPQQI